MFYLDFLVRDDSFLNELRSILVNDRLEVLDLVVHERLGEHGLIDLIVAVAAIAHQVNHHILQTDMK